MSSLQAFAVIKLVRDKRSKKNEPKQMHNFDSGRFKNIPLQGLKSRGIFNHGLYI